MRFHQLLGGTLDLTNSANYGKVRFAISVDGGATTQIDLRDKWSLQPVWIQHPYLKLKLLPLLMPSWKGFLMPELVRQLLSR